jgi:integrase
MPKSPAGTPKVKVSNGRLQIVLTVRGKREYISARKHDSKQNRNHCEMVARIIENDKLAGNFDFSLDKYRDIFAGGKADAVKESESIETITTREIWDKYTEYKRPQLSQTTLAVDYRRVSEYIDRFPVILFSDAVAVRDWLLLTTTPGQAKRILKNLSACGKWATNSKIISVNPYDGMAAHITTGKGDSDESDINPFTPDERDLIIKQFWADGSTYAPLVEFLFRTGCRPSEAIALQRKHLSLGYKNITFEQAVTIDESGRLAIKQRLKTQKKRVFPCGEGLSNFLESIDSETLEMDSFLFSSPKGSFVDIHNFSPREWKPTLKKLGIESRNIYQTRHSFITFCINTGMNVKDVAQLVGNSPEIIYKHYLGGNKDLVAPDI